MIADSLDFHFRIFKKQAVKYGIVIRTRKDFVKFLEGNFFESIVKAGVPRKRLPEFMKESRNYFMKEKSPKTFPEVKPMIKRLSKKSPIFVVSSSITESIKRDLMHNGIKVDEVMGAENGMSKVSKIRRIKKRFPSSAIFYIGDTAGDMKEGRVAGAVTVAVTWGYHKRKALEKARPDFIAHSVKELEKILSG